MKKMEYLSPEMEIIEVKYNKMLMASGDTPEPGGEIPGAGPDE